MIKDKRKEKLLYLVWRFGPISRSELAFKMNLNLPTISNLVNELIDLGKLIEQGHADSTGGRKPQLLEINTNDSSVIAVYVSSKSITSVLSNMKGNWGEREVINISQPYTVDDILSKLMEIFEKQISKSQSSGKQIKRAGIAISGIVDSINGISMKFPRCDEWSEIPLKKMVEEKFGITTIVENNIRAIGLAENLLGKYKEYKNILYINLGPGIGMGIIINGNLYKGSNLNAGEFGHITIVEDGPLCYCGNNGCLESVASDYAMVDIASNAIKQGVSTKITSFISGNDEEITAEAIFKASKLGDRFAYNLIEKSTHYIGTGIANLLNLFGSELIILGGDMASFEDQILEPINRTIRQRALERIADNAKIVFSSFGKDEGVMGAVVLALNDYYENLIL